MASVSVNVNPEIINWILHTVQFENIASSAVDLLHKWQAGEKTPTFRQVENMSKKTNIPLGYFFLDKPPIEECSIMEYRTVDSVSVTEPSRNLMDTVDLMTDIQEWMREYVIENGQEELEYVGSAVGMTDVLLVVKDIRKRLGLNKDWYADRTNMADSFRFIKKRLENIHVLVMMSGIVGNNTHRKLNINEFRAFTLVDQYAPLIFINSCDSDSGKLFSLFHELAHVWVGENSFYNERAGMNSVSQGMEKFCNTVAGEILVPTDFFLEKWNNDNEEYQSEVERIAKVFKCSRFVVARKALDNGKISQKVYKKVVEELTSRFQEWQERQSENKDSGGNYYRNLASKIDRNFVTALARSASEGRTQYTEIYRLTNTNRKTFGKLLNEMGGIG